MNSFAPHPHWRPDVVTYGRPVGEAAMAPHETIGRTETGTLRRRSV